MKKISFIFVDRSTERSGGHPIFKSVMEDLKFKKLFPAVTVKDIEDNKYQITIKPLTDDVKTREQIIFEFGIAVGIGELSFYSSTEYLNDLKNESDLNAHESNMDNPEC